MLSLEVLTKSGAIVSSAGVALLVVFVIVLLAFPVIKECDGDEKCSYTSTAPEQLAAIVQPAFLAVSLMIIAAGVFMVRFGRWKSDKKTKGG
jgi:ascorbate-specific PTS system EIIC-type component UlaA